MSKGLTIIEIIITVFILSIAVIGTYSAFSIILILTSDVSDNLTAAYLMQEGLEITRNVRDNNWLRLANSSTNNAQWTDGLLGCQSGCGVDYKTGIPPGVLEPVPGQQDEKLKIDSDGFYSYGAGAETKFKRKITITCIPNQNCSTDHIMKVSCEVFWDKKPDLLNPQGNPGSVKSEEYLYNWY